MLGIWTWCAEEISVWYTTLIYARRYVLIEMNIENNEYYNTHVYYAIGIMGII